MSQLPEWFNNEPTSPKGDSPMSTSAILRVIATICFVLATFGLIAPAAIAMVPLGLALWCGSTLVP